MPLPWRRRSRQVNDGHRIVDQSNEIFEPIAQNQLSVSGPPSPINSRHTVDGISVETGPAIARPKSIAAHSKAASTITTHRMLRRYSSMVNDVMEELQCGICLDEYNIPRLLHCGHSFCADCLKSIQYGLHIKCPTCRQVTKLQHPPLQLSPVEDHLLIDKQLPINYALTSVLDIVRNNPQKRILQCSEHQFEDQKFYCADCDQLLCSECLIIPVEMLISTDDCSTISHSGHRVVTLKRGAIELLDSLQKRQVEANAALKTLDELTSELKESINQLSRNANIARERIAEEFAKITREVEERKSQLSAEIQSDADRNRAVAEQRLADIQEVRKCIQDLHNNTHELLASKKLQPLLTVVQSQNSEGQPSSETSDTSARKFSIASSNTSLDRATPAIREAIQSLWQQGHQLKRAWADCQPLSVEELQTALRLQLTFAECRFDQATFANALQNLTQLGRIETNRQEPDVAQRLFVRKGSNNDSNKIELSLNPCEKRVDDLMRKIDPATGISHADQRLYYQSKTLYTTDSNSELMDLDLNGMNNGSALHLDVQQHLSVSEERV